MTEFRVVGTLRKLCESYSLQMSSLVVVNDVLSSAQDKNSL